MEGGILEADDAELSALGSAFLLARLSLSDMAAPTMVPPTTARLGAPLKSKLLRRGYVAVSM